MAKLSLTALDLEKTEGGAAFKHPQAGFTWRIRRRSYQPFREALSKRFREMRGKFEDEAPESEIVRATQEETARHLVTGWSDVDNDDGTPMPFSVAKCEEVLTDPKFVDLYAWVAECANAKDAFRLRATETTLGK